ncbi:TRAP transporter permease [Caenispirillum bisanense]|uniref:TRAP transporter, 4TM/12TM fusion protein n=1 Tax=Caenispirillum bisanense TaxID=414052 RepID=A0A286GFA4_9PROT|nr:TRAP transporter permease [Caenispirillum bisanense]SOD93799.1 TRAP transporter, 4TM/12TM fusion protein [Caenispirillum bisanense]
MSTGSHPEPVTPAEREADAGVMHISLGERDTLLGKLVFAIAIAFSAWQILTAAGLIAESTIIVRSIHVGFVLLLTFLLTARMRTSTGIRFWSDALLGVLGMGLAFYHWVFEADIIWRAGDPNTTDIIVGCITVVLVFEAARRVMGIALPTICALFLAYALLGQYLPSPLNHRGYAFEQVVDQMFLGTEGIYGIPTYVSATYIFLFIVFGSFLERAGIIKLFTDISIGSVGHTQGGPAKVAVVSSALMGTVNGSGVANVVTTGQFTIPMMKRSGFKPAFAGAVEATASMGGQIMPPVMGAVAFIMAETLNMPYVEIIKAAIIPAILYFGTAFWMVHLEAGRLGLKGLPKDELPNVRKAVAAGWYLLLPLAVLVFLLFAGFTPLFAGTVGLGFTAIIIMGSALSLRFRAMALRYVFWVVIGIVGWLAYDNNLLPEMLLGTSAVLVGGLALVKGGKRTLQVCLEALGEGARNALPVAVACALVGVIIGTMTLTGAATNFTRVIVEVGESNLFLSLVLTMLACLVLGMGIPTIPNYIITSSLVGPALENLGVPLIVSHMFVFYFGILADLTPPVALAAFAASPIAKASGLRIGMQCLRIAVAGFVVPYMAVYTPALMLQDGGPMAEAIGYWPAVAYIILKAVISVGLWGAASIGHLFTPLAWWERLWAVAAAFTLVVALPVTDEIGFALALSFIAFQVFVRRRRATPAAPA